MKLNDLYAVEGSVKNRKRVGRGQGSGTGKTKEKEIVKNEEKTVEPTKVAIQENEVPLAEAPVQAETSSQWWVIVLTALVLTAIGFGLYKGMQAKKVQK